MTNSIAIEEINEVKCYDISIQTLPNGKDFLILICKEKEGSNKLNKLLNQNPFDIKIYVNESRGNYSLVFEFINSDIAFKLETNKNEDDYPPLKKLKNNQITFITTGIWRGSSPKGRICEYTEPLLRLGKFDIGGSFRQAKEVQFVSGRSEKEPSAVILVYKDYSHIFETEADEAYNKLITLTKGNPTLEISANNTLVSLKIWDILIDLEVKFNELKYSEEQLNFFLQETNPNDSFAFAMGFSATKGERAVLASTKKDGFEIITLMGYSYKK